MDLLFFAQRANIGQETHPIGTTIGAGSPVFFPAPMQIMGERLLIFGEQRGMFLQIVNGIKIAMRSPALPPALFEIMLQRFAGNLRILPSIPWTIEKRVRKKISLPTNRAIMFQRSERGICRRRILQKIIGGAENGEEPFRKHIFRWGQLFKRRRR